MRIINKTIKIVTKEPLGFIEITRDVAVALKEAGIKEGFAILTTQHTTTALCVNERCERLQQDMLNLLKKIVPVSGDYRHNDHTVDNRGNAHSHLMSMLLKTTEVVPVTGGKLRLGTWQSVFFIELDGPRGERNVNVMIIGM